MKSYWFCLAAISFVLASCADSGFSGGGAALGGTQKQKNSGPSNQNFQQQPPANNPPSQDLQFGTGDDGIPLEPELPPCYTPSDESSTSIRVKGENWPNNTVDPGGADFNDYYVDISGDFELQNGWEIFSQKDQKITINYSLGSPGWTRQTVKIHVVNCEGEEQNSFDVSTGSGTRELDVKLGERFNLFTTAVTGSTTRTFDLIKDQATAYRIQVNN